VKRIWIVENAVPPTSCPSPFLRNDGVRYLLDDASAPWEDAVVKSLCELFSSADYELTVLRSPSQLRQHLRSASEPPHVVVFDWEGPDFSQDRNLEVLSIVLSTTFTYVQVYTNLGADAVEPHLSNLRAAYPDRLLPAKAKGEVTPDVLRGQVVTAWEGTIAGETADKVRERARIAVEKMLIDLCSVRRSALAAMVKGDSNEFVGLMMAKLRDELGFGAADQLGDVLKSGGADQSNEDLRRLQSVFCYVFPPDDFVRTGDIVKDSSGSLKMVITPQCHLERFRKKTGGRLTMVDADEMTTHSVKQLKDEGLNIDQIGGSPTAGHGNAGGSVVLLSNLPAVANSRSSLLDVVLRGHSWSTVRVGDVPAGEALRYSAVPGLTRLCTLTETLCAAVVSHLTTTIGSVGVSDFPGFEKTRLKGLLG
jgi:hypothetical protein